MRTMQRSNGVLQEIQKLQQYPNWTNNEVLKLFKKLKIPVCT